MSDNYFRKLGFDQLRMQDYVRLYQLDTVDAVIAVRFIELIKDNSPAITEHFFQSLLANRETKAIVDRSFNPDTFKHKFSEYLLELGIDFNQQDYFESRLRLGMVHIWAGVNLSLFQAAYLTLQQLLIDTIKNDDPDKDRLIAYVLKITHLDMSLAIMAYHNVQTSTLEEQVEHKQQQVSQLEHQQQIDTLTLVMRRDAIMELLDNKLKKRRKSDAGFCIIMADIDHFKDINDQHGHLAGDEVLREIAQRLQASLRQEDYVGRYGGEEFLLVLNNNNIAAAKVICQRILGDIADKPFTANNASITATISLGLASSRAEDNCHKIIERADVALYKAKQNGRNRVEIET